MRAIRWSDNDRYFGRFTYAYEPRYRKLAVVLSSGGDEEDGPCSIRLGIGAHTLIARLPQVIKPYRRWVDTSHYAWSKAGGGYWDVHRRQFGITTFEGNLHFYFGPQTGDSSTDKSKVWFVPWRNWRHIRRSFYDLEGKHVATLGEWKGGYLRNPYRWDVERAIEAVCPTQDFRFADYDGEQLIATTKIEEREWRLGTRWFKWLSLFRRAKISRSLDIRFSGETGKRKGSWKGGTVGHSIGMLAGELHESAFRRYCAEHHMTFLGAVAPEAVA